MNIIKFLLPIVSVGSIAGVVVVANTSLLNKSSSLKTNEDKKFDEETIKQEIASSDENTVSQELSPKDKKLDQKISSSVENTLSQELNSKVKELVQEIPSSVENTLSRESSLKFEYLIVEAKDVPSNNNLGNLFTETTKNYKCSMTKASSTAYDDFCVLYSLNKADDKTYEISSDWKDKKVQAIPTNNEQYILKIDSAKFGTFSTHKQIKLVKKDSLEAFGELVPKHKLTSENEKFKTNFFLATVSEIHDLSQISNKGFVPKCTTSLSSFPTHCQVMALLDNDMNSVSIANISSTNSAYWAQNKKVLIKITASQNSKTRDELSKFNQIKVLGTGKNKADILSATYVDSYVVKLTLRANKKSSLIKLSA